MDSIQVKRVLDNINVAKIAKDVFIAHSNGQTVLPSEAYLHWINQNGEFVRCLNLPGAILGKEPMVGTKIINGNIQNYHYGFERASGITLSIDPITGRILSIMEGAQISAIRTAAVSFLGMEYLKKSGHISSICLIGLGLIGKTHLEFFLKYCPSIKEVFVYDIDPKKSKDFSKLYSGSGVRITAASSAQEAVSSSSVIITTTTVNKGYIKHSWIKPGTTILHVSLDDLLPEVIKKADKIIVDDWNLVKDDDKRIIGRMYHKKELRGVYAEFGDILTSKKKGRISDQEIIVFNPFGMALMDVGVSNAVYKAALKQNLGIMLKR